MHSSIIYASRVIFSQTAIVKTQISVLEIIVLSAAQSFPRLLIHNAILFINTPTMHGTKEVIG